MADARTKSDDEAPPRALLHLAHLALGMSAALFASHVFHGLLLFKSKLAATVSMALAVALLASFFLPPARRAKVAVAVSSILFVLFAFEIALGVRRPGPATAAARADRAWDSRPLSEVVRDLRAQGNDAWPSARPRQLYRPKRRHLVIDGREELPLGGISQTSTVLCNESGTWNVYESDEHGFNNPRGLWSGDIELALVGDSFTQGACAPPGKDVASLLRARYPKTLNLGMLGNGPLMELGGIAEYLTVKKPKRVLWLHFRNDIADLNLEKTSAVLRRYVEEDGFRLGLPDHQPSIDLTLKSVMANLERDVPRWPRRLASLGITRRTSPVWLQDFVMNERSSSVSATLRLQNLVGLAMSPGDPEAPSARNPPDYALFQRVLEKAQALTASWGGTLTFVYMPDLFPAGSDSQLDYPNRGGVLEAVKNAGVPLIDVHAAFKTRSDVSSLVYFPHSHCNEAGYAAIAEVISSRLQ